MVLKKWDDEVATDYDINGMFNECLIISGLNLIRELLDRDIDFSAGMFDWWGDAYIDTTGRENSVNTGVPDTTAEFDTNKYKIPDIMPLTEIMYVVIEATSFGTWTNGTNDTYVTWLEPGKWVVWCDTGTDEVKRAQIHKSLWYGTDGTDQLVLDFTTITAIKSTDSRDVGRRAHYQISTCQRYDSGGSYYNWSKYTGTFVNTSTNTDISIWGRGVEGQYNIDTKLEFPDDTVLFDGTIDELGTDKSADQKDNQEDVEHYIHVLNRGHTSVVYSVILCKGDITWVETEGGDNPNSSWSTIDFYTDNSIPDMTIASVITSYYYLITHDIPSGSFSSTISSAIGVPFIEDYEAGIDIKYKLTGTGGADDTGWLDAGITPELTSFTTFTDEPDTLIVKLVPKTTSPTTGYPSIKGFSVRAT